MKNYLMARSMAFVLSVAIFAPVGCSDKNQQEAATAISLDRESVCMLDGMILLDYPGPKGQLKLKDGKTEFFCDTKSLFETLYNPEVASQIVQAWVQDFGNKEWRSYTDNWINIESAFYVFDSNKNGAMGPTIIPFLKQKDAEAFVAEAGGYIVPYEKINNELMEEYSRKIRAQFRLK